MAGQWDIGAESFELEKQSLVMGILNATPDSFSDGGRFHERERAVAHGLAMWREGADFIDVGGESTRPGAQAVTEEEERARVVPVVEALAAAGVRVSVDSSKAEVARAALAAGACVVNDVCGLRDERMVEVCAAADCGVVVMHMQGDPRTMQREPSYQDVVAEVRAFFEERYGTLQAAGIAAGRICFDPGIGFGKSLEHNLALLKGLPELQVAGRPLLIGISRKSLIPALIGEGSEEARSWGTLALTAWTHEQGARVHRVHEVEANRQALRLVEKLRG
ncbi:MAG: dihydropteroate synthase [Verrucomicrobiales bacterium]